MRLVAVAAAVLCLPAVTAAQSYDPTTVTPISLTTATYTQNFNGIANSGTTSNALPAGWQIVETGSSADATYGVGNGSSSTGNSYSFGSTGRVDRALGSLGSGGMTVIEYGAILSNALGSTITGFTFTYTGEQWRISDSTDDGLTFQYRVGATSAGAGTGIAEAGRMTLAALGFTPPQTNTSSTGVAADGKAAANSRVISGTISGLSLANGQTFGFRWVDLNSTSADDGLAVDDITVSAITATTAVPEPAAWLVMIAGFGLTGTALRRRVGPRGTIA